MEDESTNKPQGNAVLDADVFAEVLSVDQFQALLDDFCQAVGIAAAIIDVKGKVLAAARWQRACTDFHRQNDVTCGRCIESDTELAAQLKEGRSHTIYRCKNGLTDAASPIIIDGKHLANTFIGQFFTAPPEEEFFRRQAREVGFDPEEYLAAISQVPVVDEDRLPNILGFLVGMSRMVASSFVERMRARQAEEFMARRAQESLRERAAALSLAEEAEKARTEIEKYKGRLELLVAERTEELKASEERSRLLLESAGEGIFGVDAKGAITFINPAALSLLGFSESEIMGKAVHPLIHHTYPDGGDYPVEKCPMHDSFTKGASHHVEDEVLWKKDGRAFPVEYSSTPIMKEDSVMGAVITFRDITERKKTEDALRKAGNEQVAIFESLTLGIAFIKDRIILRGNRKLGELFGRPLEEMIGQTTRIWYRNEEEYLGIGASTYEDLKRQEVHEREQQLPRKDGSLFWCFFRVRAVDPGDILQGIVCILEDITERKRAERELRERMEDLERFSRLTINREEKMIQLKMEINGLMEKMGMDEKYKIVE